MMDATKLNAAESKMLNNSAAKTTDVSTKTTQKETNALGSVRQTASSVVDTGVEAVVATGKELLFGASGGTSAIQNVGTLFEIGKPCIFPGSIDPSMRVSNLLKTKMNVLEIIPCTYRLDLSPEKLKSKLNSNKGFSSFLPQIIYDEPIGVYQSACSYYGLPIASGVRIFTTDDTTSSDSFTNNFFINNMFERVVNSKSEKFASLRNLVESVDQQAGKNIGELGKALVHKGVNAGESGANAALSMFGIEGHESTIGAIGAGLEALLDTGIDIALKGKRISLPTIWSDSGYDPSLTCVIKLVSPYGTPAAIKEFIIKPLMYLLLVSSPFTGDGVTYGNPYPVTLRGFGTAFSPLAAISNITLRRGGSDTSFNVYRQPMMIDVSLSFSILCKGFAVANPKEQHASLHPSEKNAFKKSAEYVGSGGTDAFTSTVTTLGRVVNSLRPVKFAHTPASSSDRTGGLSSLKNSIGQFGSLENVFGGGLSSYGGVGSLTDSLLQAVNIESTESVSDIVDLGSDILSNTTLTNRVNNVLDSTISTSQTSSTSVWVNPDTGLVY